MMRYLCLTMENFLVFKDVQTVRFPAADGVVVLCYRAVDGAIGPPGERRRPTEQGSRDRKWRPRPLPGDS